jgi:hypothetical protein
MSLSNRSVVGWLKSNADRFFSIGFSGAFCPAGGSPQQSLISSVLSVRSRSAAFGERADGGANNGGGARSPFNC